MLAWLSPALLPGLLALALVLVLQLAGSSLLGGVGLLVFDTYQRFAPRAYEEAPVRVVDIDEESIRRYGQWPWPRTQVADLVARLGNAGASAIAIDVVFSESDRTSPPRLAEALRRSGGNAVLADTLDRLPDNDAEFAKVLAAHPVVSGIFLTNDPHRLTPTPKAGFAWSGSEPKDALAQYS
ncbi:MAG: CHASE2 domain-containing protein, partial [Novosphingobium sp.]